MARLFIEYLITDPWFFFGWSLIIVFSICVHEYGHAWMAYRLGDRSVVPHLTLNPLVQMGPVSLVSLLLFGFAWGAVPVRGEGYWTRRERARLAAAGPASNLVLSALFALLTALILRLAGRVTPAARFLHMAAQANGVLCVLNLLPAPMLDGWALYEALFPIMERWRRIHGGWLSWAVLILLFATRLSSVVWAAGEALAQALLDLSARLMRLA